MAELTRKQPVVTVRPLRQPSEAELVGLTLYTKTGIPVRLTVARRDLEAPILDQEATANARR